jgi:hypothetical protein
MFSLSRMSWVADDCTSERIPVSRDLAAATIDPHRLTAFAWAVVRHASRTPGWSCDLAALDPVCLARVTLLWVRS